ncbi:uncharacterized protein IL334_002427 [Kwoniella shivajii]|uniref:Aminoglycoside phosphotransferase domain-containing protein n=1 Tax=Kwoniella shivajii TaxID=564305 RepID=A0ABZ1CUQ3_9TREE|nr:hypothetical protein IL334_002427 [Kwoniella shivajii]
MPADFARCVIESCKDYALLGPQPCIVCGGVCCYNHIEDTTKHVCYTDPPSHRIYPYKCDVEVEVREILQILNFDLIILEVELLRPGHKCIHIDNPTKASDFDRLSGSYNFHLMIKFDDGKKWVMRIRRKHTRLQPESAIALCHESEIATIKALEQGGVRVPKAYDRPSNSEYFMERDSTRYVFISPTHITGFKDSAIAYMLQYAEWMISLEKVSFDQVGSLWSDGKGSVQVGPHIERDRALLDKHPYLLGPFQTAQERWIASINCRLKSVLDKREFSPSEELLRYLILLEMRDLVVSCAELARGSWYVRHYDLHGGNFRINRITGELYGLIDWEWSSLTCKEEAFAAPEFFRYEHSNINSIHLGTKEQLLVHSYEQLGRPDLADLVRGGRKYHRLHLIVFRGCSELEHLNAARRAFLGMPDDAKDQPQSIEEWKRSMLYRFEGNGALQQLLSRAWSKYPPEIKMPQPIITKASKRSKQRNGPASNTPIMSTSKNSKV